jgi:hypothetical protein
MIWICYHLFLIIPVQWYEPNGWFGDFVLPRVGDYIYRDEKPWAHHTETRS